MKKFLVLYKAPASSFEQAMKATNDLGGYSILQAESKEALAATLKGHPHFMMADGTIEITELMPMPGA